jgi:hypothetical protein
MSPPKLAATDRQAKSETNELVGFEKSSHADQEYFFR